MNVQDNPSDSVYEQLRKPVLSVRPKEFPDLNRYGMPFVVLENTEGGDLKAGAYVYVHPGWAYIDLLWVDERERGRGLGHRIMEKVEEESSKRGCHSAYLWTQDFEAPGFYEKLGYKRFVELENFIPGHQRIGFMKRLAA